MMVKHFVDMRYSDMTFSELRKFLHKRLRLSKHCRIIRIDWERTGWFIYCTYDNTSLILEFFEFYP